VPLDERVLGAPISGSRDPQSEVRAHAQASRHVLTSWRRRGDEGGIVAVNLVLFLGFALYAVVQLTRTTLAAQQIDERVAVITDDVGGPAGIDQNLNEVPKLDLTNETAAKIRAAADPLSGDAQQIIDAAKAIDGTVSDINTNAASINGTVKQIAGNVGSISGSVRSIGGNATSLNGTVTDIRSGVAGINQRVAIVIDLANAIRGDLSNVNSAVGNSAALTSNGTRTINGHAKQICIDLGSSSCR
jgi:methyl-accepting chemotaxis protein